MANRRPDPLDRLPSFSPDDYAGNWNQRQRDFVRLMLRYEIGARAAREAGFVPDTPELARNAAQRLLKLPHIKAYLAAERAESRKRLGMSAENVRAELEKIASANIADAMKVGADGLPYLDLTDATREMLAAFKSFSVEEVQENQGTREDPDFVTVRKIKFELHDKLGALNSLGRFHKMFTDKVEATVEFGDESRILAARERARTAREEREKGQPE